MTPNCQTVADWIIVNEPRVTDIQPFNCRRIAGTLTWSQHAYGDGRTQFGNGLDVMGPVAVLDDLVPRIRAEFEPWIAHLLWRVKGHGPNFPPVHFHVDLWPQGYGTPVCKGGSLRVRHRDGRIGTVFTDDIPKPEVDMFPIEPTSPREVVRLLQDRLNRTYGAGLVEDGVYGDTTTAAVRLFLGKMTGDQGAQDGKRVVANQWNGMTEEWIRRLAGAGGVTEARVRQLIEASRIVT